MKGFFKSKLFKAMMIIVAVIIVVSVLFTLLGGFAAPQESAAGAVATPIQSFFAGIGKKWEDFVSVYSQRDGLKAENETLRNDIAALRDKQVDYDERMRENAEYKLYFGLKEENPDFKFAPLASIISRDEADPYKTFTINRGSIDGIGIQNPVVTPDGLVGYISEVSLTYSKVTTILNPSLNFGGRVSRTGDIGTISGSAATAPQGLLRMGNLKRESSVAMGDIVISYGIAGVFPKNLKVGTVSGISQDESDVSVHVEIKPFADLDNMTSVMVITGFDGKGQTELSPEN